MLHVDTSATTAAVCLQSALSYTQKKLSSAFSGAQSLLSGDKKAQAEQVEL